MSWEGLRRKHYGVIVTDCGTPFDAYSAKGETSRSPQKKYTTMPDDELAALPVGDLAARDCFLFYWDTTARVVAGRHLPIIKAWGFKPTALAFTWLKLIPSASDAIWLPRDLNFGPGFTTRKNTELCILGRRGSPKRLSKSVFEIIISARREHSRKPEEFYSRVMQYAAGPYLELFSRTARRGWDCSGDQLGYFAEAAE